jgi:hypothetical protein
MGATHVTVAVANPANPDNRWEGLFLVDTGAIDCFKFQISKSRLLPSARTDSPPSTQLCYQLVKELTGFPPARFGSIVHYRGQKAKGVPEFFWCSAPHPLECPNEVRPAESVDRGAGGTACHR